MCEMLQRVWSVSLRNAASSSDSEIRGHCNYRHLVIETVGQVKDEIPGHEVVI
jgi:hypothetical protein